MADGALFLCSLLILFVCRLCICDDGVIVLNDDNFEHLTQASTGATTGDWLVAFTKNDNEACKNVEEVFRKIQEQRGHKLNVAKVISSNSKLTIKRFQITKWPSVSFFHHGNQYYFAGDQYTENSLTSFVDDYKKSANRRVPPPITILDVIIEDIMDDIKHVFHVRKNAAIIIFCSGILFGMMLTPILKCVAEFLVNTFLQEPERINEEPEETKQEGEEEQEKDKND